MKKTIFIYLLGGVFLLEGCSKDINDFPKSNLRAIAKFSFKPYHNAENGIFVEHVGKIDEANKTITVSLPADANLKGLRPFIELSPWTTVSPGNLNPVDFSTVDPIEFQVKAESGKIAVYSVSVIQNYKYTKAELYSVTLPDLQDENNLPLRGTFPNFQDNVKTDIVVPENTDLSRVTLLLNPTLASQHVSYEVSEDGGISYRPFTNPGVVNCLQQVVFKVIPEVGTPIRYRVKLMYPEVSGFYSNL